MYKTLKCAKHPKYMAKRKPTSGCVVCTVIWEETNHAAKQILKAFNQQLKK